MLSVFNYFQKYIIIPIVTQAVLHKVEVGKGSTHAN